MQNKVELCGVNTAKLKVLKNEETQALLRRAKAGDRQAREELIAGNLRLVLSVIHKFSNRGENVDDLFQVGCIGLIKAIDNFNTDLDVRFSTYGVPMIVGEIRRYLRDNSTMRVSRAMRDTAYKVLQAKEAYLAKHQKEPTRSPGSWTSSVRTWSLPWTPSWSPSPCMNPSTPTAGTPSASWTR